MSIYIENQLLNFNDRNVRSFLLSVIHVFRFRQSPTFHKLVQINCVGELRFTFSIQVIVVFLFRIRIHQLLFASCRGFRLPFFTLGRIIVCGNINNFADFHCGIGS